MVIQSMHPSILVCPSHLVFFKNLIQDWPPRLCVLFSCTDNLAEVDDQFAGRNALIWSYTSENGHFCSTNWAFLFFIFFVWQLMFASLSLLIYTESKPWKSKMTGPISFKVYFHHMDGQDTQLCSSKGL